LNHRLQVWRVANVNFWFCELTRPKLPMASLQNAVGSCDARSKARTYTSIHTIMRGPVFGSMPGRSSKDWNAVDGCTLQLPDKPSQQHMNTKLPMTLSNVVPPRGFCAEDEHAIRAASSHPAVKWGSLLPAVPLRGRHTDP
jgi:hypothetical protein